MSSSCAQACPALRLPARFRWPKGLLPSAGLGVTCFWLRLRLWRQPGDPRTCTCCRLFLFLCLLSWLYHCPATLVLLYSLPAVPRMTLTHLPAPGPRRDSRAFQGYCYERMPVRPSARLLVRLTSSASISKPILSPHFDLRSPMFPNAHLLFAPLPSYITTTTTPAQ